MQSYYIQSRPILPGSQNLQSVPQSVDPFSIIGSDSISFGRKTPEKTDEDVLKIKLPKFDLWEFSEKTADLNPHKNPLHRIKLAYYSLRLCATFVRTVYHLPSLSRRRIIRYLFSKELWYKDLWKNRKSEDGFNPALQKLIALTGTPVIKRVQTTAELLSKTTKDFYDKKLEPLIADIELLKKQIQAVGKNKSAPRKERKERRKELKETLLNLQTEKRYWELLYKLKTIVTPLLDHVPDLPQGEFQEDLNDLKSKFNQAQPLGSDLQIGSLGKNNEYVIGGGSTAVVYKVPLINKVGEEKGHVAIKMYRPELLNIAHDPSFRRQYLESLYLFNAAIFKDITIPQKDIKARKESALKEAQEALSFVGKEVEPEVEYYYAEAVNKVLKDNKIHNINIPKVFPIWNEGGLIMEFVQGKTLNRLSSPYKRQGMEILAPGLITKEVFSPIKSFDLTSGQFLVDMDKDLEEVKTINMIDFPRNVTFNPEANHHFTQLTYLALGDVDRDTIKPKEKKAILTHIDGLLENPSAWTEEEKFNLYQDLSKVLGKPTAALKTLSILNEHRTRPLGIIRGIELVENNETVSRIDLRQGIDKLSSLLSGVGYHKPYPYDNQESKYSDEKLSSEVLAVLNTPLTTQTYNQYFNFFKPFLDEIKAVHQLQSSNNKVLQMQNGKMIEKLLEEIPPELKKLMSLGGGLANEFSNYTEILNKSPNSMSKELIETLESQDHHLEEILNTMENVKISRAKQFYLSFRKIESSMGLNRGDLRKLLDLSHNMSKQFKEYKELKPTRPEIASEKLKALFLNHRNEIIKVFPTLQVLYEKFSTGTPASSTASKFSRSTGINESDIKKLLFHGNEFSTNLSGLPLSELTKKYGQNNPLFDEMIQTIKGIFENGTTDRKILLAILRANRQLYDLAQKVLNIQKHKAGGSPWDSSLVEEKTIVENLASKLKEDLYPTGGVIGRIVMDEILN